MIKHASDLLKENYNRIGPLTDPQFIAAKARACAKRLLHVENITEVRKIEDGLEYMSSLDALCDNETFRIRATVRSMLGGKEQTGLITLENIQEIYRDEAINMLVIEAENMVVTTIDCKNEVLQINAVLADANWVNEVTLSELLNANTMLRDFQEIRDGEQIQTKDQEGPSKDDWGDLGLDLDFKTPDLMF